MRCRAGSISFLITDYLSLLGPVCVQEDFLPSYILLSAFFFLSFPRRRVCGKFAQLCSNELLLGQRLPGRQQRLPQLSEYGQGRAEDPALLPRRQHRHAGEERKGRGPDFSAGSVFLHVRNESQASTWWRTG